MGNKDNKIAAYKKSAIDFFKQGYNCAQSVVLAYSDFINIDEQTLAMLASPFGAGMGRMREVCGAVSGMFIVLGLLEGCSNPVNPGEKKAVYEKVQALAEDFKQQCGSIICSDLLNLSPHKTDNPEPAKRNDTYYKKRPCADITGIAAEIIGKHLLKSN